MNEFEKGRMLAKQYREQYPPGTRMVLLSTTEVMHPVPIGMRGTVQHIDDMGQMHMRWDNGRTLPLIEEDGFRKLTPEELAEEQKQKEDISEEQNQDIDEGTVNEPTMGM